MASLSDRVKITGKAAPEEDWNDEADEILTGELDKPMDYSDWNGVDVIEGSECPECKAEGRTILMLHKIPHFRELIIASFKCHSCFATNNEVTFGGEIQIKASKIELKVTKPSDLNRQLIKSDYASVTIPEMEFEIPPGTQKGEISTVEGILSQASKNLAMYQADRLAQNPEVGIKVAQIIMQLNTYIRGEDLPFTIVLDDISGNSFIENPIVPAKDPQMKTTQYVRNPEQDQRLGLEPAQSGAYNAADSNFDQLMPGQGKGFGSAEPAEGEEVVQPTTDEDTPFSIPSSCANCAKDGEMLTCMTSIPHFKEVLIMAFTCKFCGYKSNEVKGGGAIPPKGQAITLHITSEDDLKRDVLKGDSAMLLLPGIELELSHGSLGGVYTTVEGLLNKIYTNLRDNNPFAVGDAHTKHHSAEEDTEKKAFRIYLQVLQSYAKGEGDCYPFDLILRDPLGNSFISAPLGSFLPPESDKNLELEEYERTFDENEEFGLNDMNTADFETVPDEYKDPSTILPDRLTHVLPKGPDHPLAFAQGTHTGDATSSQHHPGKIVGSVSKRGANKGEDEDDEVEPEYMTPPDGYSAGRVAKGGMEDESRMLVGSNEVNDDDEKDNWVNPRTYGHRQLGDDSHLEDEEGGFEGREEFAGFREGCVFRLGSLGVGYYKDYRKSQAE